MKYYAGIGARETPAEILELMKDFAKILAKSKYILRSGGAAGADSAFEMGCDMVNGQKEIYLPWKNFRDSTSELWIDNLKNSEIAAEIAAEFHPKWKYLRPPVKNLMARNTYQILGKGLNQNTASMFVICYCEKDKYGNLKGGTSQALRIAQAYDIPIYNLHNHKNVETLRLLTSSKN
jgi:hypothetical protein